MRAIITRFKALPSRHEFRVYVIESSTLKRFVVMEIVLSSIVYSIAFYVSHNELLAEVGSWAGIESLKRLPVLFKRMVGA